MGILTEECNFFRFLHCQFGNISYFCSRIRILYRFIDILNSEAPCFILTKREPENSLLFQKSIIVKVGNVVQLFPRLQARTSVIFHLQGFSGPPLQNIGAKSAPQCINIIRCN